MDRRDFMDTLRFAGAVITVGAALGLAITIVVVSHSWATATFGGGC